MRTWDGFSATSLITQLEFPISAAVRTYWNSAMSGVFAHEHLRNVRFCTKNSLTEADGAAEKKVISPVIKIVFNKKTYLLLLLLFAKGNDAVLWSRFCIENRPVLSSFLKGNDAVS